uniref:SCP domain-containing protein n=1 Tax=Oryza glumipatula TaxID=40148 RepID=A0A0E0AFG1_9ORYZ
MYVRETGLSNAKRFALLVVRAWRRATARAVYSAQRLGFTLSVIPPANLGQGSMLKLHVQHVVWRRTAYVGCARVACNTNNGIGTIIACNYYPRGNIYNERPY